MTVPKTEHVNAGMSCPAGCGGEAMTADGSPLVWCSNDSCVLTVDKSQITRAQWKAIYLNILNIGLGRGPGQ